LVLIVSLIGWFSDSCHLEVACCLRKDAAVQGRSSLEQNASLDQKDALHVCTCSNLDKALNLPEDILCLYTARQDHFLTRRYHQVPRHLNDEDVVGPASEGDVRVNGDVRLEGVDAVVSVGRLLQSEAANFTRKQIDPRGVGVGAPPCVGIRDLHVADRGGQKRRSGRDVARRVGMIALPDELRGRGSLCIEGRGQAEAGNCCRGDGRDGDVTCDGGPGHGGDAGLREDRILDGSPELDISGGDQLTFLLNTSEGLGICRKQGGEEDNGAARFGKEHRGLENLTKYDMRELLKLSE
jgi:hypothetical protein